MTTKFEQDAPGNAMPSLTSAGFDMDPLELVDDAELRAELQEDPDLRELTELTALAASVRALVAPERADVVKESDRLQQIEQSVLYQHGILPIAIAEMDAETKRHILDTSAKDSLSSNELSDVDRSRASKRITRARNGKDGP
jgi:hypothetical protein